PALPRLLRLCFPLRRACSVLPGCHRPRYSASRVYGARLHRAQPVRLPQLREALSPFECLKTRKKLPRRAVKWQGQPRFSAWRRMPPIPDAPLRVVPFLDESPRNAIAISRRTWNRKQSPFNQIAFLVVSTDRHPRGTTAPCTSKTQTTQSVSRAQEGSAASERCATGIRQPAGKEGTRRGSVNSIQSSLTTRFW